MPDRSSFDQTGDYRPPESQGETAKTTIPATEEQSPPPYAASVLQILRADLGSVPKVHLREPDSSNITPVNLQDSPQLPVVGPRDATSTRLQLLGEIARGGMGAVLKGRDVDLGRDIAVKVLLDSHAANTELARRFLEEAQINGQLQHPGIVPVYELGVFADRRPYFTMKLVKGKTLAALLAARKKIEEERGRYLGIFTQVCQTLAYAHARGVLHRDLKPSNIMVGSFGEVQVMDWGLAKLLSRGGIVEDSLQLQSSIPHHDPLREADTLPADSRTQTGSVLGTPAYMAPEQARGDVANIDERTDVFGLGGLMCEILTGKPPFTGKAIEAHHKAQTAQLQEVYSRLESCGAEADLIGLAKRCLSAEQRDRPQHAGEVAHAMTAYQQSVADRLRQTELARAAEEARAIEAQATAMQERKAREAAQLKALAERRSRRLALALAAVVLLSVLGGGGGWLWLRIRHAEKLEQNNHAIQSALNDALTYQGRARSAQGATAMALSVQAREQIQRAEALVESGPVDGALAAQVRAKLAELAAEDKDRALLAALETARLAQSEMTDARENRFAAERAVPMFREAFRVYGMKVGEEEVTRVAERIAERPLVVREAILAALDEWIVLTERPSWKAEEPHLAWLKAVLTAADPVGWGNQVRKAAAEPVLTKRKTALEQLAKSADVKQLSPRALTMLAERLQSAGAEETALTLLRHARLHHVDDFWINLRLGVTLGHARNAESVVFLTAAVALRPHSSKTRTDLGYTLRDQHRFAEAVDEFQQSIQLDPVNSNAQHGLGLSLFRLGKIEEASAAYRRAIEFDPTFANPHNALGFILAEKGKFEEAIAEYHQAIELDPEFALAHYNLGNALRAQGKYSEAIAAFRKSIQLEPKFPSVYQCLGLVLARQQKYDEAIAAFNKVIELDRSLPNPYNGLGNVYKAQGKLEQAIDAYRKALQLDPDFTFAKNNLKECERTVALAEKLPRVLRGEIRPASAAESLDFANLCANKKHYLAAVRLFADAFTHDPKLAEDLQSEDRYNASCCAALAASGQGDGASKLNDNERQRWRTQALKWLSADLTAYAKLVMHGSSTEKTWALQQLKHWQEDADLSSLRNEDALRHLPEEERRSCRSLWADVEKLIRRAQDAK